MTVVLFHYQAPPDLARRLAALAGEGIRVTIVAPDDAAGLGVAQRHRHPHLAWLTGETLGCSLDVAVDTIRRLASGDPLLFTVA